MEDFVPFGLAKSNKVGDIKPIPITAKILDKNGFYQVIDTCRIDTYRYYRKDIDIYIFMFSIPEITVFQQDLYLIKNLQIKYIHQLQHVLHMCGMEDLVNNFKI
jgi:hypothetical protein